MTPANLLQLIILAAIWGASFLFMRIAVPALGPVWLIDWRVLLGVLLLALAGRWFRHALTVRTHWRYYLVLGLFNTALPFVLFVCAAPALTVTFLIPVFGILSGHLFLGEAVGWQTLAGSLVVLTGTALVTGFDPRTLLRARRSNRG